MAADSNRRLTCPLLLRGLKRVQGLPALLRLVFRLQSVRLGNLIQTNHDRRYGILSPEFSSHGRTFNRDHHQQRFKLSHTIPRPITS